MKLRHERNLLTGTLTGATTASERVPFTPADFSGTLSVYLEVEATNSGGAAASASLLVNGAASAHSVSVAGSTAAYTLFRSAALTSPAAGDYQLVGAANLTIKSARLVILQDTGTSELFASAALIEIGNRESAKNNTTAAALAAPKYWKYEAATWDGTLTCSVGVTYSVSDTMGTVTLLLQTSADGSSWSTAVTLTTTGTSTTPALLASTFTPVDGNLYRVAAFLSSSMYTYAIYNAHIEIKQAGATAVTPSSAAVGSGFAKATTSFPRLLAGSSSNLNFERTDSFSVSFWAYMTNANDGFIAVAKANKYAYDKGWVAFLGGGSTGPFCYLQLNAATGSEGTNELQRRSNSSSWTQPLNQWVHWVVTYNGTSSTSGVVMYRNGSQVASYWDDFDSLSASIQNTAQPSLMNVATGSAGDAGTTYLNSGTAALDEVLVYSGVLTSTQVSALYSKVQANYPTSPLAWWKFEGNGQDASGNGIDVTSTSGAAIYPSPITKGQRQYLLANAPLAAGTAAQKFLTRWDPAEWSGVDNTYRHAVDAGGTGSTVEVETSAGVQLSGSSVASALPQALSSAVTMPASATDLDVQATTNGGNVYASRLVVDFTQTTAPTGSVTATPSTATLTVSEPAPTITAIKNVTTAAAVNALTVNLPAPTIRGSLTVSVGVLSAALTQPAAALQTGATAQPAAATAALSQPAPAVTAVRNVTIAASVNALTASLPAPTVRGDAGVVAGVASVALSGPALAVATGALGAPAVATAALAQPAPTVTATQSATVAAGVLALTLTLPAPTVATASSALATPATADATATSPAPSVAVGATSLATPAAVAVTTPAPGVATGITTAAAAAGVAVSAPDPTVYFGGTIPAPVLTLSVSASAPQVSASGVLPVGVEGLTLSAPDGVVTTGATAAVPVITLSVTAPSVGTTLHALAPVGVEGVSASAPDPTIEGGALSLVNARVLTGSQPAPTVSGSALVAVGVEVVTLDTPTATAGTQVSVTVALSAEGLTLTLPGPSVAASSLYLAPVVTGTLSAPAVSVVASVTIAVGVERTDLFAPAPVAGVITLAPVSTSTLTIDTPAVSVRTGTTTSLEPLVLTLATPAPALGGGVVVSAGATSVGINAEVAAVGTGTAGRPSVEGIGLSAPAVVVETATVVTVAAGTLTIGLLAPLFRRSWEPMGLTYFAPLTTGRAYEATLTRSITYLSPYKAP